MLTLKIDRKLRTKVVFIGLYCGDNPTEFSVTSRQFLLSFIEDPRNERKDPFSFRKLLKIIQPVPTFQESTWLWKGQSVEGTASVVSSLILSLIDWKSFSCSSVHWMDVNKIIEELTNYMELFHMTAIKTEAPQDFHDISFALTRFQVSQILDSFLRWGVFHLENWHGQGISLSLKKGLVRGSSQNGLS